MRKSGIIFFELTVISLIFACTSDKAGLNTADTAGLKTYVLKENKVHVAWDPVTTLKDNSPISEINISYSVYISDPRSKNKDAKPVLVDYCEMSSEEQDINNPPIACFIEIVETSCIIKFNVSGTYFIGVQSVVLIDDEEKFSEIAWSDNKIYTKNNPFVIQIPER